MDGAPKDFLERPKSGRKSPKLISAISDQFPILTLMNVPRFLKQN